MGKFSLEQIIKERLKGHEVHIDKNELWNQLGIEDERKDRKAIWFWWLGGLVGVAALVGIALWMSKPSAVNKSSLPSEQMLSVKPLDQTVEKIQDKLLTGGNSTNDTKETEPTTSKGKEKTMNSTQVGKEIQPSARPQQDIKASTVNTKGDADKNVSMQPEQLFDNKDVTSNNWLSSETNSNPNDIQPERLLDKLTPLPMLKKMPSLLSYHRPLNPPVMASDPFIKPVASLGKLELEFYGALGTIKRSMNINERFLEYLMLRNATESPLEHLSFGGALRYNLKNGLYGKVGIAVNRWNEKFQYSESSDTVVTTSNNVPVKILIDLQGNENITYGEGNVISYSITDWTRFNRLTQIDLPLSIGYEKRFEQWSIFAEATALVNLSQSFSGYLYDTNFSIQQNPEAFKSRLGINWAFNVGTGYALTPSIRLRASARYYRSTGNVLLGDDFGGDQRFSSIGLAVGVGYLF